MPAGKRALTASGGGGKRPAIPVAPAAKLAPAGWSAPAGVETVLVRDYMPEEAHADSPMRVAAFDFDGCLADTSVFRRDPSDWKMMFSNVPAVLRKLHEQKFRIVIVTNESIDRFVKEQVRRDAVMKKTHRLDAFLEQVAVPCYVIIAFAKDEYRKPSPNAWSLIKGRDGLEPDKATSFFVGDACGRPAVPGRPADHANTDLEWAENVKIRFYNEQEMFVDCVYEKFIVESG